MEPNPTLKVLLNWFPGIKKKIPQYYEQAVDDNNMNGEVVMRTGMIHYGAKSWIFEQAGSEVSLNGVGWVCINYIHTVVSCCE